MLESSLGYRMLQVAGIIPGSSWEQKEHFEEFRESFRQYENDQE